jgi:alpha-D-ribose 1-methylphosphonate 5-triphosphate synthase subunit PhnG
VFLCNIGGDTLWKVYNGCKGGTQRFSGIDESLSEVVFSGNTHMSRCGTHLSNCMSHRRISFQAGPEYQKAVVYAFLTSLLDILNRPNNLRPMIDDPDLEMVVDLMSPDYQEAARTIELQKEEAAFFKALRKEEAALAKAKREVKEEEAALAKALKKEEAALAKALKEEAALAKDGIKRKQKYKLCRHPDGCEKFAQGSAVGGSGFCIAHGGGNRCQLGCKLRRNSDWSSSRN